MVEAGARLAFGWLRNQYGLRDRRPLGRFALRTLQFLAAGRRAAQVEARLGRLEVRVSTSDRTIARSVYTSGDWDPLLVGTAFDALDALGVAYRGKTFLEVGANFGVYSLPAVAEYGFAHAIAYEPDPAAYELLVGNAARNGLAERVSARHAALSSTAGELTLSLGGFNAGDNRIVRADGRAPRRPTVRVPALTFDQEVAAGRIGPAELGLVWLDVQGHEYDVLRGARELLSGDAALVVEYCTAMMEDASRAEFERLLAEHFDVMVDLGWCALTGRLRFQPASAVHRLAAGGRAVETDLLFVHRRPPPASG